MAQLDPIRPKTCCQQILMYVMKIVIFDLGGYFSIIVCYHNGMNKAKIVTIILVFTFHVGL